MRLLRQLVRSKMIAFAVRRRRGLVSMRCLVVIFGGAIV
jgi:hypothetical protein